MDGLSSRDLRLLRDALDPQLDAQPGDLIAQPVLDELARVIPSENVTLQVMNYGQHKIQNQRIAPTQYDLEPELRTIFWAGFWDFVVQSSSTDRGYQHSLESTRPAADRSW